jgi:hypothetical protein
MKRGTKLFLKRVYTPCTLPLYPPLDLIKVLKDVSLLFQVIQLPMCLIIAGVTPFHNFRTPSSFTVKKEEYSYCA